MSLKLLIHELRETTADRTVKLTLPSEPIEFQGDIFTAVKPAVLEMHLHPEGNSIAVTGSITGEWSLPCSRCLQPTRVELDCTFEDMWPMSTDDETAEDFYASAYIEEDKTILNVTEYGMEVLLEHLPMRSLCSVECQGLCSACGANLNFEECNCGKRDVDPRLAVLGRLLNDKGGVRDGTT